jgi:hypothetical protein
MAEHCACASRLPLLLCAALCEARPDVAGLPPGDPTRVPTRGQLTPAADGRITVAGAFSTPFTSILQVTAHFGELP